MYNVPHVYRFNIQNMNRQARLYHQGLVPIIKVVPGKGLWERLRETVECEVRLDEGVCQMV